MLKYILSLCASLALAGTLGAHEHHPPHQGSLQVFGKEMAHLELCLDARSGKLTAYALDGEAENAVRLKQRTVRIRILKSDPPGPAFAVTLRAVANPLTGETLGDSSQFEGGAKGLLGLKGFEGKSGPVTIRGVAFESNVIRYPQGNE